MRVSPPPAELTGTQVVEGYEQPAEGGHEKDFYLPPAAGAHLLQQVLEALRGTSDHYRHVIRIPVLSITHVLLRRCRLPRCHVPCLSRGLGVMALGRHGA